MNPERPDPPPEDDSATLGWLDGLAGRASVQSAHADGARLREALLPLATEARPAHAGLQTAEATGLAPWAEIERRADAAEPAIGRAGRAGLATAAAAPAFRPTRPAANQPWWRPAYGLAAALLLAGVVTLAIWPGEPQVTLRGGAPSSGRSATWQVAQPERAAQALAADLRALGAKVESSSDAQGVWLRIAAPPAAVQPANRRLAELEAVLDTEGRLSLRVVAP